MTVSVLDRAREIAAAVRDAGGRALIVGGWVRDRLMGVEGSKDIDLAGDPTMTVEEAVRRRDFTINAIAWDPLTDEYLDPSGGRADIERRLLRVVDRRTFADDSLRVLRSVQFAARFEFALDDEA